MPADVDEDVHVVFGACPVLIAANLGLLLIELTRAPRPAGSRALAAASGVVGLTGALLFLDHHYLGLGAGGMERVAALPLLLRALVTGARVVRLRMSSDRRDRGAGRAAG